jgi:hypothetical protein
LIVTDAENREYAPSPQAPEPRTHEMRFTGSDKVFSELVRNGAFLEIVTFGFYRFWLATKIRHYLWSHTALDDDAFSYHGTARELLIGFLFAVAILAPVYLAFFLLGVEAEREQSFASAALGLFFIGFFQFALYRARRYRLYRTSWRGVRFGMDGSGVSYALRAMGWGFLAILTLGLALPWLQAGLERYKMRHTYYGDLRGDFVASGGALFKKVWTLWLGSVAILGAYVAMVAIAATKKDLAWILLLSPLLLPAVLYVYGRYKSVLWKWWVEGVRVGAVRATSSLGGNGLVRNYFVYAGFAVLTVIFWLAFSVTTLIVAKKSVIGVVMAALAYIAMIVTFMMLWRIYFVQRVWKIVVNSLTIHDLAAAEEVAMRPEAHMPSALGEGFADSLDVGGL